jgi:uncharacterized repeat protein (TIGR04052 family)
MKHLFLLSCLAFAATAADLPVSIQFHAVVGNKDLACGQSYPNIGTTRTTVSPRDFRFYVHDVSVIDDAGNAIPIALKQDEKWQLDNVALLDFEDATGGCSNGTPEKNSRVVGAIPASTKPRGLRFTLGVPMEKNHTDLTKMPSPLNLTALAWSWNAGRKFARLDFSSTGSPRGSAIHLGSTGCTPNDTRTTIPTKCAAPNRLTVDFPGFDVSKDIVIADLAALLKDSNADASGCMSGPRTAACGPLFLSLGLPFPGQELRSQTFFRVQKGGAPVESAGR